MRSIDADKIQWKSYPNDYGETNDDYVEKCDIDNMPTVDAVVVTRCKDCRSYNKPKTGWCEVHLDREHPDDFCSYGKRKDGGAE
jgi:hypothetical protein